MARRVTSFIVQHTTARPGRSHRLLSMLMFHQRMFNMKACRPDTPPRSEKADRLLI